MAFKKRMGLGKAIESDLEILPLMNLFVVLIPMLLLSAVFLEMSVIRMNLPPEVAADEAQDDSGAEESLLLAVTIRDDAFVVEGRGIETIVIAREKTRPVARGGTPAAEDGSPVDGASFAGSPVDDIAPPGAAARLQELLAEIAAAHPENEEAMVIARKQTRYDDIVVVMDAVRDAGMPQISLLGTDN
ncbi:MAG: hypothetical protein HKN20_08515 [Gemmatimonadetes bacterium]|nr:hypothetical protein [Gemmatimonadota bacterium]